ncbi:symmetrical bis(5'-nucleosyl)-tetraphosphatase [Idiomarina sp. HP20-50]|uniref:symmetrical bis(5'-nucleosyl)-tetraphosphatase n=1 Tax=Idiomarina sp. HP20-50 TaxID=3070813 RepID=UPI00294B5FDF|nr:symmetrical bis(5'-nucleosyl)-tetraphosphatase [Idiomarina sp. HP20-50]MDV6315578.1 symmetrical bis(5'-nucleosyl)-tetraphosphatase [Idiomarina sp. HP20-50]
MSHYIVGDIQGCFRELEALLTQVSFNPTEDSLWCVGDIVARGPDSRDALRFFYQNSHSVHTVLGNHDLNLMAVLLGFRQPNPKDKLDALLADKHRFEWLDWLRQQPLMQELEGFNTVLAHAGIYPWWTLSEAGQHAKEVEAVLVSSQFESFMQQLFGDTPKKWRSSLQGFDRYRFIVNAFTRMRYCRSDGELDFSQKDNPYQGSPQDSYKPWFTFWPESGNRVLFGHWAALMGETRRQDIIGLDTGCVWGQHMTLYNVESKTFFHQPALTGK